MPKKRSELIHSKVFYYGTSINNSFWQTATEKELSGRGFGELWLTGKVLNFRLYLTSKPFKIPVKQIFKISTGYAHARKISLSPVLKIFWKRNDIIMASGFSLPKRIIELRQWQSKLQKILKAKY